MSGGWWFRLDGEFVENPKVMDLSDRAFRLHVAGLCYTTRNLTDGILTPRSVKVVCALTSATRRHVIELRDAGLWIEKPEGGFEIKDYLLHNPDAATVKEIRDAKREAGRLGGIKSGQTRRRKKAEREAKEEAEREASASSPGSNHGTEQEEPSKAVTALHDRARARRANGPGFEVPQILVKEMPA